MALRYDAERVSKLGQLLSYLEREDVHEVVFRTGEPALLHSGTRSHPLTVVPLSRPQIHRFFEGTPVATWLSGGDRRTTEIVELEGSRHRVRIRIVGSEVEIGVSRADRAVDPSAAVGTSARSPGRAGARPPRAASAPQDLEDARAPTPALGLHPRAAAPAPEVGAWTAPSGYDDAMALIELSMGGLLDDGRAGPVLGTLGEADTDDPTVASNDLPLADDRYDDEVPTRSAALTATASVSRDPAPMVSVSGATMGSSADGSAARDLAALLAQARVRGASDVHIVSGEPVRTRVAGLLTPQGSPLDDARVRAMIEPLLGARHAESLTSRGYADLGVEIEGAGRLRLNVCRQRTGLKACFRLVASRPPTLRDVGAPPELERLTRHHQGLAIVSGPSGHGKTTTMAAIVDMFNASRPFHIITIEDPVEVIHPPKRAIVTQREVGTHTQSFGTALAAALREDPDVVAIGELRDRETVEMALQAAETGHLVAATMSTPSGAKTIQRMIDMFPPDDQEQVRATLAGALKLIVSQRLVPTADGRGQVAAFEMLTGNVPLWSMIRDKKLFQIPSLLQRGRAYGMIRLEDSLRELVERKAIRMEDAIAVADDPRALDGRSGARSRME